MPLHQQLHPFPGSLDLRVLGQEHPESMQEEESETQRQDKHTQRKLNIIK